jgi:hypothetical protein
MPNTDHNNLREAKIDDIILHSPQDWEGIFNTITDVITIHGKENARPPHCGDKQSN